MAENATWTVPFRLNAPAEVNLDFDGAKRIAPKAMVSTLTGAAVKEENASKEPLTVSPKESTLKIKSARYNCTFPSDSLTVLRLEITN